MRIITTFACLVLALIVTGCTTTSEPGGKPVKLESAQFIGRTLRAGSELGGDEYRFFQDGSVSVTSGSNGGKAQVFDWQIVNGHTLIISGSLQSRRAVTLMFEFRSFGNSKAVTTRGQTFKVE